MTREKIQKMLAVLTPAQQSQLREKQSPDKNPETDCSNLSLSRTSFAFLPDSGAAEELGFSTEQRERVRKIVTAHWMTLIALQPEEQKLPLGDEKAFKAIGEKRRQEMANLRKQIEAALTPAAVGVVQGNGVREPGHECSLSAAGNGPASALMNCRNRHRGRPGRTAIQRERNYRPTSDRLARDRSGILRQARADLPRNDRQSAGGLHAGAAGKTAGGSRSAGVVNRDPHRCNPLRLGGTSLSLSEGRGRRP